METIFHINEKLQIKTSRDAHSSCHFLLNTLKGTAITQYRRSLYIIAPKAVPIDTCVLTPKRYVEHPRHFIGEFPRGDVAQGIERGIRRAGGGCPYQISKMGEARNTPLNRTKRHELTQRRELSATPPPPQSTRLIKFFLIRGW